MEPTLDQITLRPPLDYTYSDELDQRVPKIAGGLSVALARSFTIIDPKLRNPATEHWERAMQLFNLLL